MRIIDQVENISDADLDMYTRRSIARDIATLRDQIGVLVEVKQKSFLPSLGETGTSAASRLALTNTSSGPPK